ncbi:MAG: hypothetical protein ACI9DF_003620 [Verrucomicrobiales bacterium]|jgi:hypothetical protein
MSPFRLWYQSTVFVEVVVICLLVLLPVYWVRKSRLKNRIDENLIWKLLACGFLFGLGSVSGLRLMQNAPTLGTDQMTFWFLPLMGTLYLHVGITHDFKKTFEIALFFLLISYLAAWARSATCRYFCPALSVSHLSESMFENS